MTLHRFMSKREYDALMTGEVLRNETDHGAMGQKTDSVGFCFFPEPPDEAIHWLSFIVDADLCVTMEIPDAMVRKSQGRYRDVEKDKSGEKMSVDSQDATPEELRTDGTDAFDELYMGVKHFRNGIGFVVMPEG